MRLLMKMVGVAAIVLLVAAAGALTAPHWLDETAVRKVIAQHLGQAIGGKADLRGPMQWRLLPTPQATLRDVSLNARTGGWSADASTATLSGTWADLWREAQKFRRDGAVGPPVPKSPTGPNLPGWSRDAIDLSDLRLGAGTLRLQATRLQLGDVILGRGAWTADLQQGVLQLELADGQAFGGRLALTLQLDTNKAALQAVGTLKGRGLDLGQLAAALGKPKASAKGRLDVDLALTSAGASAAGLVAALNGKVTADLVDGSFRGIDLGSMLRAASLTVRGLPGGSTSVGKAHLQGNIRQGVLYVDDGNFVVVPLTVQASGSVALAQRTFGLSLNPQVDPSLGVLKVPISVLVPVEVTGPWHKPVFRPELEKLPTRPLQIACDVLSKAGGPVDQACQGVTDTAEKIVGGGAEAVRRGVEAVGTGIKCLGSIFSNKRC